MRIIRPLLVMIIAVNSFLFKAKGQLAVGRVEDVKQILNQRYRDRNSNNKDIFLEHRIDSVLSLKLIIQSCQQKESGEFVYGAAVNFPTSRFFLQIVGEKISGSILLVKQKRFFRYFSTEKGQLFLKEEHIDSVLCIGYPDSVAADEVDHLKHDERQAGITSIPALESLPNAGAVIYLDFDGQTITNTYWNHQYTSGQPIVAQPSAFINEEIIKIWKLVSEDYRPFAINVTTDEAVFNNAPANGRVRVIFTPTNNWYPYPYGGVAQIGSFPTATTAQEAPCWVWIDGLKPAAEAASHEAGHTFGLYHRGRTVPSEEYFSGQNEWAPIMGIGNYRHVVQWSKGEYPSSNNSADDLYIISTQNGFGYRVDDHGNSIAGATPLVVETNGDISGAKNRGVISTRSDVDVFSIQSAGGRIALTVQPDSDYPNLDIGLTLRSADGSVIASADPTTMEVSIDAVVPAGTYYLSVDGVTGSLGANSDYASLGQFNITNQIYCKPIQKIGCGIQPLFIESFSFNTLRNNNTGCSSPSEGYTNYDPTGALTTTVTRGQSYQLNIIGSPSYDQFYGVWIDFNGDRDFNDPGELVFASAAALPQASASIMIPASSFTGTTRMRIRSSYDNLLTATDYCSILRFGETEDYTITITGSTASSMKVRNLRFSEIECKVNLIWDVAEEINGAYYIVERSTDAVNFSEIGRVVCRNERSYSFMDSNVGAGTYRYRLRMVDNNNQFNYSDTLTANLQCPVVQQVMAFPIPSKGVVTVRLYEGMEAAQLRVFDAVGGEVVRDGTNSLVRTINLKHFANGLYIIAIIKDGKMIDQVKVLLNR